MLKNKVNVLIYSVIKQTDLRLNLEVNFNENVSLGSFNDLILFNSVFLPYSTICLNFSRLQDNFLRISASLLLRRGFRIKFSASHFNNTRIKKKSLGSYILSLNLTTQVQMLIT